MVQEIKLLWRSRPLFTVTDAEPIRCPPWRIPRDLRLAAVIPSLAAQHLDGGRRVEIPQDAHGDGRRVQTSIATQLKRPSQRAGYLQQIQPKAFQNHCDLQSRSPMEGEGGRADLTIH